MGILLWFSFIAKLNAQQMWISSPSTDWIEPLSAACVESVSTEPSRACCRSYTRIWVEAGQSGAEMGGLLLTLRTDLAKLAGTTANASSICVSFEKLLTSTLTPPQRAAEAIRILRAYKEDRRSVTPQIPELFQKEMEEIALIYTRTDISGLKELCLETARRLYKADFPNAPLQSEKTNEAILDDWNSSSERPRYEARAAQSLAMAWNRWLREFPPTRPPLKPDIFSSDVGPYFDSLVALGEITEASQRFDRHRVLNEKNMNQSLQLIEAVRNRLREPGLDSGLDNGGRSNAAPLPPRLGQENVCWINEAHYISLVEDHLKRLTQPLPTMAVNEVESCNGLVRYASITLVPMIRAAAHAEAQEFFKKVERYRAMVAQTKPHCDIGWAISELIDKVPSGDALDPSIVPKLRQLLGGEAK